MECLPEDTDPGRAWAEACTFPKASFASPSFLFPVDLSPFSHFHPSLSHRPPCSTLYHTTICTFLYTEDDSWDFLCLFASFHFSWACHAVWQPLHPWPCGSLLSSGNVRSGGPSFALLHPSSSRYHRTARNSSGRNRGNVWRDPF